MTRRTAVRAPPAVHPGGQVVPLPVRSVVLGQDAPYAAATTQHRVHLIQPPRLLLEFACPLRANGGLPAFLVVGAVVANLYLDSGAHCVVEATRACLEGLVRLVGSLLGWCWNTQPHQICLCHQVESAHVPLLIATGAQ